MIRLSMASFVIQREKVKVWVECSMCRYSVCEMFNSPLYLRPQSLDYDICYNVPYKEMIRKYSRKV